VGSHFCKNNQQEFCQEAASTARKSRLIIRPLLKASSTLTFPFPLSACAIYKRRPQNTHPLDAERANPGICTSLSLRQTFCRSRSGHLKSAHKKPLDAAPQSTGGCFCHVFTFHSSSKTFDGRVSAREPTTVAGTVPGDGH
jgi:hypothetical protein